MGEVKSRVREITEEERDALTSRSDWYLVSAEDARDLRVLEFDVAIDSITKYFEGLPEAIQCYVLGVGSGTIGFELCFMDRAVATGSFPSDHVRIAFAVRSSSEREGKWEEIKGASWAVSYHWYGDPIEVKRIPAEVSLPSLKDLLPIYRLWGMEKAQTWFTSAD